MKDSAGLVAEHQEDQREGGDKNKTLYSHNTPQTKKIKGRFLYQFMGQTQGKNPVAFLIFAPSFWIVYIISASNILSFFFSAHI
jgi:hypothetical protein